MMDANGCNTTAAAAVARLASVVTLAGARAVILGGTGPVGIRAATLFAREGATVLLASRSLDRAKAAAARVAAGTRGSVTPVEVVDEAGTARALEGADVCLAAGAASVRLVPEALWAKHPSLKALADVNAVPPLGIAGIEAGDKGAERHGKRVFGALGIGGLKMKVHRTCVARLFETNDAVIDLDAIYGVARAS
jgi:NAD(P)-dependent dehydrogenase (short-subunit alcohol dehydrogenase family)